MAKRAFGVPDNTNVTAGPTRTLRAPSPWPLHPQNERAAHDGHRAHDRALHSPENQRPCVSSTKALSF